jgi:hypothetical protein
MPFEQLILDFAQALGGVSKRDGDIWLIELPVEGEHTRVLFFRLNSILTDDNGQENLLVCFTRLGDYRGGRALQRLEGMLRLAVELKYARIAILEGELVLFSVALEAYTEASMLEMVHEIAWMGEQLSKELTHF